MLTIITEITVELRQEVSAKRPLSVKKVSYKPPCYVRRKEENVILGNEILKPIENPPCYTRREVPKLEEIKLAPMIIMQGCMTRRRDLRPLPLIRRFILPTTEEPSWVKRTREISSGRYTSVRLNPWNLELYSFLQNYLI